MINPTFKQVVESGSKALKIVRNDGRRFIGTTMASQAKNGNGNGNGNGNEAFNPGKAKCDTGRCSRLNMDTKQYLNMPETNYLQPSKTQNARRRFVEAQPLVKPEIVYEHEQYCREKEECKRIQTRDAEDNVKKP